MKKRLKAPSPSMVVSIIALVLAMGGTSIAAVSFARNAGAVNGKSAVSSTSSLRRAAGKLVATKSSGPGRGQIPAKFLELTRANVVQGHGLAQTFGTVVPVLDNQTAAPAGLVNVPFFGTFSITCRDENNTVGREDPQSTLQFTNQSGTVVNFGRSVNNGTTAIGALQNGAVDSTSPLSQSHTFHYNLQDRGIDVVIDGVVRQDGRNSSNATCTIWGQAVRVG